MFVFHVSSLNDIWREMNILNFNSACSYDNDINDQNASNILAYYSLINKCLQFIMINKQNVLIILQETLTGINVHYKL